MVDALVVVTQNSDGEGLPHTAAVVRHKLALCRSVAAFGVSLGCSGYVYEVAPHIRQLLSQAGLAERNVDAYCLRQGGMAILSFVNRRFPGVEGRFVKDMGQVGNTASSSIPLALVKHLFLKGWNRVIISGFCAGLLWVSVVLKKWRG